MKIQNKFQDLEKANAYIEEINVAFKTEVEEKKAEADKAKTLQKSLDQANADLEKSKVDAEKISTLETALEQANTDATSQKEIAEAALQEVETLSAKLDLQEKHGSDGVLVTVKKKNYKLIGNRFLTKFGEFNAEELSKHTEALEFMAEKGSASLVPLDK